ncbi:hypothetical protein Rt10032_c01g0555 [Rhodotorula toruloides]|uniref:Uncharacterized protein n=1 Tax=Rhodotorula toruloides TaxID=5286 RepID=A0A511K860_RHOTO|nr:hypothetical protein Rt10032_c01g0555 [Rhodotorula toruloides]
MDAHELYDPPHARKSTSRLRARSASLSASSAPSSQVFGTASRARRQSLSSVPTTNKGAQSSGNLSDEEHQEPLIDLSPAPSRDSLSGSSKQSKPDAAADHSLWRDGRQSKQQMQEDDKTFKPTPDMESFMAQLYDLTHAIDALENDIDEIVCLRNKIVKLDPKVDVGQVSLCSDLDALAALTTQTGKGIVSLETWLRQLSDWSFDVEGLVKQGKLSETQAEIDEIKYHVSSAMQDFREAMERIREGAEKERFRRERTRIWMVRHIRHREPGIKDEDIFGLLRASELGAADGIVKNSVTSYAGLFALQNPFTELEALTRDNMCFFHDVYDDDVVNEMTGRSGRKRVMNLKDPRLTASKKPKKSKKSSTTKPTAPASRPFFGSRYGFISTMRPQRTGHASLLDDPDEDAYERKFRYIQGEQMAAERDLEYGFARQYEMDRVERRKKGIIALLAVIILALIVAIIIATMPIPRKNWAAEVLSPNSSSASTPSISPAGSTKPTDSLSIPEVQSTAASVASIATAGLESVGDNLLSFASSVDAQILPTSALQSALSFTRAQATMSVTSQAAMSVASQVQGWSQQQGAMSANNGLWQPAQQAPTMPPWQGVQ